MAYKFNATNDFRFSRFIYYARLKYKVKAFQKTNHPSVVKDFDFAELIYYGRVSPDMYAVRAKSEFMKPIPSGRDGRTIMAMDFVVDAFNSLVNHFNTAADLGQLDLNNAFLTGIVPFKGWENPDALYNQHIKNMMDAYVNKFLPKYRKKIQDVRDFVDYLIPFAKRMTSSYPLTYSAFQVSKLSSPFTSGLVIDIAKLKIDNDKQKEEHFLNNQNLEFYLDTCKAHGFYVSHNAPHILYADVGSAAMKQFMSNHGASNPVSTFNVKYEKIYNYDIDYLKTAIYNAYTSFITNFKFEQQVTVCGNNKIKHMTFERKDIDYNTFSDLIDDKYMIKLYNKIKNIEEDEPFAEADVEKFSYKAIKLFQSLDKGTAIHYINNQYRSVMHSKPGSAHDFNKRFKAQKEHRKKMNLTKYGG